MKQHGPWKIKSSEVKYKNAYGMEVFEDQVIQPDGKDSIYGVVTFREGISVLPLDDKGCVYFAKEFRYAIGRESIEAAGGIINDAEAPLEAAKRELREELGIVAQKWTGLGRVDPFTGAVRSAAHLYLAQGLSFVETKLEGTETILPVKVAFEEALGMVMRSQITHGPSCVLILKAAKYLGKL